MIPAPAARARARTAAIRPAIARLEYSAICLSARHRNASAALALMSRKRQVGPRAFRCLTVGKSRDLRAWPV